MSKPNAPGQREAYQYDPSTTAVPLSNSDQFFLIDTTVWDRREELGLKQPFFLNSNGRKDAKLYVRFRSWGLSPNILTLSRVIMGVALGRVVQHRNGNLLDCRKSNLVVR